MAEVNVATGKQIKTEKRALPEEQTKLLNAVFSVDLASKIIAALPFDEAITELRNEVKKRGILSTREDEPLFIYEVVSTSRQAKPYRFQCLVSSISDLQDKWEEDQQAYYDEIGKWYGLHLDGTKLLTDFMKALTGSETSPQSKPDSKQTIQPEGFVFQTYQWYDYTTLKSVPKQAVLNLVEKDSKLLLIGASYVTAAVERIEQEDSAFRLLIIIAAYLAFWAVISFLFLRRKELPIAIGVGTVGSLLLYFQHTIAQGPRDEITYTNSLRNTSIAIAAASLGISIFLRRSKRKAIVILVLLGFFLALFPLILSGVNFGPGSLAKVNAAIVVMLALSVSCIVTVLFIALPSAGIKDNF